MIYIYYTLLINIYLYYIHIRSISYIMQPAKACQVSSEVTTRLQELESTSNNVNVHVEDENVQLIEIDNTSIANITQDASSNCETAEDEKQQIMIYSKASSVVLPESIF